MQEAGLLFQVVFALGAVLGVIWVSAKLARRSGLAGTQTAALRIVGRQMLGRDSSVAVMTVGGRAFIIGVTAHQVSVLSEVDPTEVLAADQNTSRQTTTRHATLQPLAAPVGLATVTQAVDRLRAKTVRQ
jgi:flagellar biosynthetic protein FliO